MSTKKKFLVTTNEVLEFTYLIEADTEEEALEILEDSDYGFDSPLFHDTDTRDWFVSDVEEVE